MKERPILFNTEMVRAILDGRKTQTRRVVVPQPEIKYVNGWGICKGRSPKAWTTVKDHENIQEYEWKTFYDNLIYNNYCPYGFMGDQLWVRETWNTLGGYHHADSFQETVPIYKASWTYDERKWKPSIHMPKKYSRIQLEVLNVRVERVQDIKPIDCVSEGIYEPQFNYKNIEGPYAIATFANLWDSINAKRGFGWDLNPWVWVVEFKVIKP